MKVMGLDNKEYKWNLISSQSKKVAKSKLHQKAKALLEKCFPHDPILEEISLPGSQNEFRGGTLRADFFIPNRNLIVEVNGEQHFKFNAFHFKNKLSFFRAQARDRDKKEWCKINDIIIIEFNYNESEEDWKNKI